MSYFYQRKDSGGHIVILRFSLPGYDISIQLNISSRKAGVRKGEIILIANDFIPAYNVMQLPENLLIGEKIEALLSRAKPRDYFDLYFILRSNLLPVKERGILPRVLDRLNREKDNLTRELKDFLPRSHHGIIKDFSAILRREIERFLISGK